MFEPHRAYPPRTRPRAVAFRCCAVEPLESRSLLSAAVSGVVQNVYPGPDGAPVTTPLAGWRVFDDVNRNGVADPGEAVAVTGLDGSYTLNLAAGSHMVRLAQKAGWSTPVGYASATSLTVAPDASAVRVDPLSTAMTNPVVIDVVAFTADSTLPWSSLVPGYFRTANQVFANSNTNVRLNLVGVRPAGYDESGNLYTDLARLAGRTDGYMDTLPAVRDQLGADLAVLFDPTYPPTAAGLAYIGEEDHPDPDRGYGVVCYTGDPAFDGFTTAHEIGHLLGADHDADHGPGNSVPYARGYRFTGNDGVLYHDVMAYPPGTTLPFFSSPDLSYAGRPLGVANVADNVRAIREMAPLVAGYRSSHSAVPAAAPSGIAATAVKTTKARARAGTRLSATATVRNTGAARFSGKVVVSFYLSTDKTLGAEDALLGSNQVTKKKLKAKGVFHTSTKLVLGRQAQAGKYYVLAVATTAGDDGPVQTAAAAVPLNVAAAPAPKRAAVFQAARRIEA